jgi:hypothetical protein
MEINFKNIGTIKFGELRTGSEFIYEDRLYLKISGYTGGIDEEPPLINATDMSNGRLYYFTYDKQVVQCKCKVDVNVL